jgi:putative solute:sodium symporter small subunit
MSTETPTKENRQDYWRANLKLLALLLTIWFTVSFGCGILFVDALNQVRIGGFKLGFWFAQQGAIYVFVVLILVYVMAMNRLDEKYNVAEERMVKTPRRKKNIKS